MPGAFTEAEFFEYLDFKVHNFAPEPQIEFKNEDFSNVATVVANAIKNRYFPNRDTIVFRDTRDKPPPGYIIDTKCTPDITAAFEGDWKNGLVHWPFIRLSGKTASVGKSHANQKRQAISCLHSLLLARPDLYVAQGLLTSNSCVTFLFGIGGAGIRGFQVEWTHKHFYKFLYAFIYRLYEPGDFADPSYINTEFDENFTAKYTIKITYQERTQACPGFHSIYAGKPFGTRTHVLSNPGFKLEGNDLTILKDQFCRVERRFKELNILTEHIHKPWGVPGVVAAAYGETVIPPSRFSESEERCKHRLGLGESGLPFMSIPTLREVLETLFDVLEVLRYLRDKCKVLHRDISAGNVLYIENLSNRSLPPNCVPVPPRQEATTNGMPLCYAKYLLEKSDNPLETSMLLVDFNVAEYLGPETRVKQNERTGTPLFMARAVAQGGPLPAMCAFVPGIPNSPDFYAEVHPDRVQKFPNSVGEILFIPEQDDESQKSQPKQWRHELQHDAESVFWLLVHWAIVVQPEEYPKETIGFCTWSSLVGDSSARDSFVCISLRRQWQLNLTHSFYKPLEPLIKDLADILAIDSHWLKAPDPRKDTFYVTEAFQRLILKFMIENRENEIMDRRVEKTFREVERLWYPNRGSTTDSQMSIQ